MLDAAEQLREQLDELQPPTRDLLIRPVNIFGWDFNASQALFVDGSLNPLYAITWAVPLAYAMFWFAYYGPSWLAGVPDRIGDLSYGVYIWHMPVVNVVLYLGLPVTVAGFGETRLAVVVAATFALAALSWHLIEKRALRMKPHQSRTSLILPSEGATPQSTDREEWTATATR